jgi:hypothetical protein
MTTPRRPRFAELLDWLEQRLPPDEARALADRLDAAGAASQADLAWLRSFLQASRSVKLAAPPPEVRQALRQRFAEHAQARPQPGLFERLVAALSFDSRAQAAAAGVRSATSEGQQRQLIYTSRAAEIALNIQPQPSGQAFTVSGQVFPLGDVEPDAFSLQLLQDAAEVALALSDELGEFSFPSVPGGEYELVLSTGRFEIIIPGVRISD